MRLRPYIGAVLVLILASGCTQPTNPGGDSTQTTPVPTSTPTATPAGPSPSLAMTQVMGDLNSPVYVTTAPGDPSLFVVEQEGLVQRWNGVTFDPLPFLDVRGRISCCGERGLLSIAFAPDYPDDARVFAYYTDDEGNTVVARYPVTIAAAPRADASQEERILRVGQPYSNHNGGLVVFGPQGYLFVGLGDGGSGGDPLGHGQNTDTLLGSILRLDVSGTGYDSPGENPFVGKAGQDEIWAYGLRNPWRFSFDSITGDLFIADVGQNEWEEIDWEPASSVGGINYGWNRYEGSHTYDESTSAPESVGPVYEYAHAGTHCSVTGGHVYRGQAHESMYGRYYYADYCSGNVWSLTWNGTDWTNDHVLSSGARVTSFGVDATGQLLLVDHQGAVYRLSPAA